MWLPAWAVELLARLPDSRLTTASTSDGMSPCVRVAGGEVELFSSGPLVCEAVVMLFVADVGELLVWDAVVCDVVPVAAGVERGWLLLDKVAATCCTMVEISSVVNGRVSFPEVLLSAGAGGDASILLALLRRVYGRLEAA